MQALKALVVVMSVLIVAGLAVIGVTIVHRLSAPLPDRLAEIPLHEPAGTHIAGITTLPDRLAVLLQGGGPDRIRLLDARTLQPAGEVRLVP
jgi:Family of unknown function (DUF6476)